MLKKMESSIQFYCFEFHMGSIAMKRLYTADPENMPKSCSVTSRMKRGLSWNNFSIFQLMLLRRRS